MPAVRTTPFGVFNVTVAPQVRSPTRPARILTLLLVQHHGPEERGVLPRAIRPRLQEAGPFALAQSCSWKTASKRAAAPTTPREIRTLERRIAVCTRSCPPPVSPSSPIKENSQSYAERSVSEPSSKATKSSGGCSRSIPCE